MNKSEEINEIVKYGLDSIDPNTKVEISLRDFLEVYKTFDEFNRFFHNSMHFETLSDVKTFMGNKNSGGYSLIHKLYYKTLDKYLPNEIRTKLEEDEETLVRPGNPYYFK